MEANFNRLAPFYDFLVKLVFGESLWEAQRFHMHKIDQNDRVLILGGGTGKILHWLPPCHVTYVESSEKMMERAMKHSRVDFIQIDFHDYESNEKFDWVICPFFLDVFNESDLNQALYKIASLLEPNGQLLVTDFRWTDQRKHQWLIRLMLAFFKVAIGLKTNGLQPIRAILERSSFKIKSAMTFNRGLIFSDIYNVQ